MHSGVCVCVIVFVSVKGTPMVSFQPDTPAVPVLLIMNPPIHRLARKPAQVFEKMNRKLFRPGFGIGCIGWILIFYFLKCTFWPRFLANLSLSFPLPDWIERTVETSGNGARSRDLWRTNEEEKSQTE